MCRSPVMCRRRSSIASRIWRESWASRRWWRGRSCGRVITRMRWCLSTPRKQVCEMHLLARRVHNEKSMRAAFIVLDGLDGTGKSTQCRLLADRLRAAGHDTVTCVDPGGTALGAQLREVLLHHRGDMAPACEALL